MEWPLQNLVDKRAEKTVSQNDPAARQKLIYC